MTINQWRSSRSLLTEGNIRQWSPISVYVTLRLCIFCITFWYKCMLIFWGCTQDPDELATPFQNHFSIFNLVWFSHSWESLDNFSFYSCKIVHIMLHGIVHSMKRSERASIWYSIMEVMLISSDFSIFFFVKSIFQASSRIPATQ